MKHKIKEKQRISVVIKHKFVFSEKECRVLYDFIATPPRGKWQEILMRQCYKSSLYDYDIKEGVKILSNFLSLLHDNLLHDNLSVIDDDE